MFPTDGPTLIVDGTNLLVRSEHAAVHAGLSIEDAGEEVNTGAIHLFAFTLAKYTKSVNPARMIVCWDGGRSWFRTNLYPEYKSGRKGGHGDDIGSVRRLAREFLTVANIHHIEVEGWEADDIVAAHWRRHRHDEVVILSGDKDFLQLVGNGTIQIRPQQGKPISDEIWDEQRVISEIGCKPSDLTKVMALAGDLGDDVPGIQGIGNKTAIKMLEKYGWSLPALLQSDEKKVQGQAGLVDLWYQLVDLQVGQEPAGIRPVPPFNPTQPHHMMARDFLDWCSRYQLENLADKFRRGDLWK
jgi:DNA polymerase-1